MKIRWLVLFLVLSVLWGCDAPPEPETLPATEPEGTVVATDPTVPSGLYSPDSPLELATAGALRVFPLSDIHVRDIRFVGEDLLLFSGDGHTVLTLLSGAERYIAAEAELPCRISPEDPSVVITAECITYYDSTAHELVTLNRDLIEISRITLSEEISGRVALSPDCSCLYYCTDDAIRILDPETGESRLLTRMDFVQQELVDIHCDGTVLECSVADPEGYFRSRFLSARDGSLLYETDQDLTLQTNGAFYFAVRNHGFLTELITGSAHSDPSLLLTTQENPNFLPVSGANSLILITYYAENDSTYLDCCDLESGICRDQLTVPGNPELLSATVSPGGDLWLLVFDPAAQSHYLGLWSPKPCAEDAACHLLPLQTGSITDPTIQDECISRVSAIGETYGIQLLLQDQAADAAPWDYDLIPEYRIAFISYQLEELEQALALYPEGFVKKVVSEIPGGNLYICLVGEILGLPGSGALESATGIQYWDSEANAYIALIPHGDLSQNLFHELFHVIESRVYCNSNLYDDWQELNPEDFSYDFDYLHNLSRAEAGLTSGIDRAFIDLYSMSYPKEDRARIMEYAMMPGNEDLFTSPILQQKLRTLCLGIRDAFNLKFSEEPPLWEQYLEEPIRE